jgi:hypothetical protein
MPTSSNIRSSDVSTSNLLTHVGVGGLSSTAYTFYFYDHGKLPDIVKVYFKVDGQTVFQEIDFFEWNDGYYQDQHYYGGSTIYKGTSYVTVVFYSQIPSGSFYIRAFFFS